MKSIADRWARSARTPRERDRQYGERLVEFVKEHSSEGFVGCDEPLEAAIFSVLVELLRDQDQIEKHTGDHVDP